MNNFFITGLPRSRTTWLANFFTHANSYCFHELGGMADTYIKLRDVMRTKREGYVGTADSSLPYYFEDLVQGKTEFRLAIIERDISDVYNSFSDWYGDSFDEKKILSLLEDLRAKLEYMKLKYNPLVLQFEDLNDEKKMEQLWSHCIPGLRFDADRYKMLNQMKIEPVREGYFSPKKVKNVQSIMGEL